MIVENGHYGNTWAGPIATLMIEKYLNKKITRTDLEKRMLEGNLNWQYRKLYPSKDSIHKPKLVKTDSLRMKLKPKKEVEKDKKKEAEKKKVTDNKK